MKRARAPAITVSSDYEAKADSHFEPPKKQKKMPFNDGTTARRNKRSSPKSSPRVKRVKKTAAKSLDEESKEAKVSRTRIVDEVDGMTWSPAEVIARNLNLDLSKTFATCSLLQAGNSLPFLARYRREATGGMGPDTLRQVKENLDNLMEVKAKAEKLLQVVNKQGKLVPAVATKIKSCETLSELELVSAAYKTGSKSSLAERARQAGLEDGALSLLTGTDHLKPHTLVRPGEKGRETVEEVKTGMKHIIADLIVHDNDMIEVIRKTQDECSFVLESKKAKEKTSEKNKTNSVDKKDADPLKFENYFEFSCPCKYIKPHQVLAINRGESLKVLSVKIVIPDWFIKQIKKSVQNRWLRSGKHSVERTKLVDDSLEDAYKRLIAPLVQRKTRASLTKAAEEASILVFLSNLRSLLLTPPHRGSTVMAIDPGFSHGCKVAVLSPTGTLLDQTVLYPRFKSPQPLKDSPAGRQLISLARQHRVTTVAIGNGTACRETEAFVSDCIAAGLEVQYTIVSEQGASIYSCSSLASQEFPDLDTNIISAVSIGRRLQDPLSELVKVEPHHLGVGMYQHDLSQARLSAALEQVVEECVSFVGVDINSCSEHLLRRVAGLNKARARAVIEYREKQGELVSRAELRKVKGVGEKVYQQCAGFIRVVPRTGAVSRDYNPLDRTQIHPESYSVAEKVVSMNNLHLVNLGKTHFCQKIKKFSEDQDMVQMSKQLEVGEDTLKMILEALQQDLQYDLRAQHAAPLFKVGLTKVENVKVGDVLSGRVNNVTHFGAFVDIGLGINGLIHTTKMKGNSVELGNRLEVKVVSIELQRKRIGLEIVSVL